MIIGAERVPEGMLFHFQSTWKIPSDLISIWNAIGGVERWPEWWRSIEEVEVLHGPMLPVAVGTSATYRVRSPLGYSLAFRSDVTAFDLGKWLETAIAGNLAGKGRWDFDHTGGVTTAILTWDVAVTRPVLARLAALAPVRQAMSWAHDQVMDSGERGLRSLVARTTGGGKRS